MGKTIAIDFDGVIHKYRKGWEDGSIYDDPVDGVLEAMSNILSNGHSVFILSTRNPRQIKKWLSVHLKNGGFMQLGNLGDPDEYPGDQYFTPYCMGCKVIPWYTKFWNNKQRVIGITNRKLAAHVYIDDRALVFTGDWTKTIQAIDNFKTYQQ